MKYTNTCECCGHKVTAFTHQLNKGLAEAFKAFVDKYAEIKAPVSPSKDLNLTHTQLANWQKLRYWDLIKPIDNNKGLWVPTPNGILFYQDRISVMKTVATINAEVLPQTHEAWETHTKNVELVRITDLIDDFEYKQRPDYQAEKSGQMNF